MRDTTSVLRRLNELEVPEFSGTEDNVLKIVITIVVAVLFYIIARKWIPKFIKVIIGEKNKWDDILFKEDKP